MYTELYFNSYLKQDKIVAETTSQIFGHYECNKLKFKNIILKSI